VNVVRRGAASGFQAALALAILAVPAPALAQSRFEIGAAVTWTAGFDAGGTDALLTRNPATGSSPFVLFETSSRVNAAPGIGASVGFSVTPRLVLEATGEYSRPVLRSTISSDAEAATGTTADSRLTSVVAGGSVVYLLHRSRLSPFAAVGAGWLRQLDEDRVMLVTGMELHAGGGMLYSLTRKLRLRIEVGASSREKTIAFANVRHVTLVASAGLRYRF